MKKPGLVLIVLSIVSGCFQQVEVEKYEPTWESLSQWEIPEWFEDAVLGIYCHWGVYSVPGYRFNSGAEQVDSGLWYGMFMYNPDNPYGVYDFHCKTYGDPAEFGYHDLVPLFEAEKWDPDRWAELYKSAGADFAGVCAEHGDGFAMWDSELTPWNASDMGPGRDITGELASAIRKREMKVVCTFHHARVGLANNHIQNFRKSFYDFWQRVNHIFVSFPRTNQSKRCQDSTPIQF